MGGGIRRHSDSGHPFVKPLRGSAKQLMQMKRNMMEAGSHGLTNKKASVTFHREESGSSPKMCVHSLEAPKRVPKQPGTKMSSAQKSKTCHFDTRPF